jgi:hypothetical protein
MGIAQFGVAVGLVNEANLGTWFISERLRDGGHLFLAGKNLIFVWVCCIFLLRVFCDLLGGRAHGRIGIFDFVNASV